MFKKIVFPVYGDEVDDKDIDLIVNIAEKYNSTLFLITVSEIYHTGLSDLNVPEELFEQHRKLLEEHLNKYKNKFEAKGVKTSITVQEGNPYREILDFAEKIKAGLIIIPTHGRTGLPGFIMGSVAQKIVKLAKCPVLTFKPRFKEDYINE
jgi:nucleotide-binding universal stress UspA family protein